MSINVKNGGVWKEAKPYVKNGGVWKEVQEGYVKDGGVWKPNYLAADKHIYVSTTKVRGSNQQVFKIDTSDMTVVENFDVPTTISDLKIGKIVAGKDGFLYAKTDTQQIIKMDPISKSKVGSASEKQTNWLSSPYYLSDFCVGDDGFVYCSYENGELHKYDLSSSSESLGSCNAEVYANSLLQPSMYPGHLFAGDTNTRLYRISTSNMQVTKTAGTAVDDEYNYRSTFLHCTTDGVLFFCDDFRTYAVNPDTLARTEVAFGNIFPIASFTSAEIFADNGGNLVKYTYEANALTLIKTGAYSIFLRLLVGNDGYLYGTRGNSQYPQFIGTLYRIDPETLTIESSCNYDPSQTSVGYMTQFRP